ncbi:MAG: GC-type dockerin domain-anchored protein [Planctomycetota bacterium]
MAAPQFADRSVPMYEAAEWTIDIDASAVAGNPFDVDATARFVGSDGSEFDAPLFYMGETGSGELRFGLRFTGTAPGVEYSFTTSSGIDSLDGATGSLSVEPADGFGFVTSSGSKFAVRRGAAGELGGFLLNIVQSDPAGSDSPFKHMHLPDLADDPVARTQAYADYAVANGFSAIYVMLNNHLSDLGAFEGSDVTTPNPDLLAFDALDQIVATANANGLHVHFWRWGDANRGWTAENLPGGINGEADRRVTEYLAKRLGALPSWSIGYGFDLHEWVTPAELEIWKTDLKSALVFPHLISARSYDFESPTSAILGYAQGDNELGESTPRIPDYDELVGLIAADPQQPHLLEERNVLGRWGLDSDGTRLLMWRSAMAGGVGGWYGFFNQDPVFDNDIGYTNPAALKSHATFWRDRFELDMQPANELVENNGDGTLAVRSEQAGTIVVFAEETDRVQLDFSDEISERSAVAVDTKAAYAELDIGVFPAHDTSWSAPYTSDWALYFTGEPGAGCAGDVNGDGTLDSADFFAWVQAFDEQRPEADVNRDGDVTGGDFFAWVDLFQNGC